MRDSVDLFYISLLDFIGWILFTASHIPQLIFFAEDLHVIQLSPFFGARSGTKEQQHNLGEYILILLPFTCAEWNDHKVKT